MSLDGIKDIGGEEERSYLTCGDARTSFVEKRSEFICSVAHVENEQEAAAFIQKIRSEFSDARHNVYAYSLYNGGVPVKRFSDDGEPKGTAGMPVLEAIEKSGITDVALVVTRYFGGILLGASGLTRAYSNSATEGLAAAGTVRMVTGKRLTFRFGYDLYGKITKLLENYEVIKEPPEFTEAVALALTVPVSQAAKLVEDIIEATSAGVVVEAGVTRFVKL